jgi:hypothetical protein
MPNKMPGVPIRPRPEDEKHGSNFMSQKMISESRARLAKSKRLLRRTVELLRRFQRGKSN